MPQDEPSWEELVNRVQAELRHPGFGSADKAVVCKVFSENRCFELEARGLVFDVRQLPPAPLRELADFLVPSPDKRRQLIEELKVIDDRAQVFKELKLDFERCEIPYPGDDLDAIIHATPNALFREISRWQLPKDSNQLKLEEEGSPVSVRQAREIVVEMQRILAEGGTAGTSWTVKKTLLLILGWNCMPRNEGPPGLQMPIWTMDAVMAFPPSLQHELYRQVVLYGEDKGKENEGSSRPRRRRLGGVQ